MRFKNGEIKCISNYTGLFWRYISDIILLERHDSDMIL
jgi:hypothetical protein